MLPRASKTVISIPVSKDSDVIVGELTGQMIKDIGGKNAAIELKGGFAAYKLPEEQIKL